MSETGDILTCPRASDIFFCKYCDHDSDCGRQINEMTGEERDAHFKKVFSEFEEWRVKTFQHSSLKETQE